MRRGPSIAALLLLVTCADAKVVPLDLPRPDGMLSMLVGVEADNSFRIYAYALDDSIDDATFPHLETFEGNARVYAFFYNRPLDELGLEKGEVPRERDPAKQMDLPDFDAAYRQDVNEDAEGQEWEMIETSGAAIGFSITRPPVDTSHCPQAFDLEVFPLETTERFNAAAPVGPDEVLGFSRMGTVVRITPNGVEMVATSTDAPDDIRAAAPAKNGEVWLGLGDGTIVRGHPDRGYTTAYTIEAADPVQFMDGPPNPDAVDEELYAITRFGKLIRYDGTEWTQLHDFGLRETSERFGAMTWVQPELAVTIPPGTVTFGIWRREQLFEISSEHAILAVYAGMTRMRDGRVVAMTTQGLVLEGLVDQFVAGFVLSTEHSWPEQVYHLAPHREGFAYLRQGLVPVYGVLDAVECSGTQPDGYPDHVSLSAAPMGDALVFMTSNTWEDDFGPSRSAAVIFRTR